MKNMYPVGNTAKDKIEIPSKKDNSRRKRAFFSEEHYCLSHSQVLQEQLLDECAADE